MWYVLTPKFDKVTVFYRKLSLWGTFCTKLSDLRVFREAEFFYNGGLEREKETNIIK